MLTRNSHTRMGDKNKDHPDAKEPPQKQQTCNVATDDMENTNDSN